VFSYQGNINCDNKIICKEEGGKEFMNEESLVVFENGNFEDIISLIIIYSYMVIKRKCSHE